MCIDLRELGWIEDRTVTIAYHWAEGRTGRFAEIAAEFVRLNADIIVAEGTAAVVATKQATSSIPIVFPVATDPVGNGLVASLARPGGNVTGLSAQHSDLSGKRLEFLREIVPNLHRLAIMANINSAGPMLEMDEVQAAARILGLDTAPFAIRKGEDIVLAFKAFNRRVGALYVCADPLVTTNLVQINTLAVGARLPTMYGLRESVAAGGLISYGPNLPDLFRRSAEMVDKILRGAKPADIPVEQPTKFDLVINLTTAKATGLIIPESLLLRANEVIE